MMAAMRASLLLLLYGCVAGGLYEELMSIEPNENPLSQTNRVKFSSGGGGVKKGDLITSDEQFDWLFGDNAVWMLKNLTEQAEGDPPTEEEQDELLRKWEEIDKKVATGEFDAEVTDEEDVEDARKKRAGTEHAVNLWPNGVVPYILEKKHFDEEEKNQLMEAMRVYEELTCLQFVQRTNEPQWLYIHHTDDGCYSLLGDARKFNPGPQPISLQKPGCRHIGTYLHELGHAIGLVHEHQLPTRNKHVRYFATNVDPTNADQLEMYSPRVINTYGTGYDLGSIMHYDIFSFSIDDTAVTLGVDNPWLAPHIGRRYSNMLSFGDVRTVNSLYGCAAKKGCDQKQVMRCHANGAYMDSKCECITPQGFHRENCKDKEGFETWCEARVPTGQCDILNIDDHRTCRKSCGFCPVFLPGDTAIGTKQAKLGAVCADRYYNPAQCRIWKAKGFCVAKGNPWMHRYCRATCGFCASKIGDCTNIDPDSMCDRHARNGWCGALNNEDQNFKEFLQVRCADSCNTCGYRNRDLSCRNSKGDDKCAALAKNHMCEIKPLEMFRECASTCNRCYWDAGQCTNKASAQECAQMGLQNYCKTGGARMNQMRRQCPKTCDSCVKSKFGG